MPGGVTKLTQWGLEWTPVPEPSAYGSVAGALLLGLAWRLRRRSP
jgi:MYXO-CTERM domain-containing protein